MDLEKPSISVETKTLSVVINRDNDDQKDISRNISRKLDTYINMFHPDLNAILLSYENIKFCEDVIVNSDQSPYSFVEVAVKCCLFRPRKDIKLVCKITHVDYTFAQCNFMGNFPITLSGNVAELKIGMYVLLEILSVSMAGNVPILECCLVQRGVDRGDYSPGCSCGVGCRENGPYYTQLGHASSGIKLRRVLEKRLLVQGEILRMEEVKITETENDTKEGCPSAKRVLRRAGPGEKFLCIWKFRPGHKCKFSAVVVAIISWDAISQRLADRVYEELSAKMPRFGLEMKRACERNKKKTCKCQGQGKKKGASYTFGCSVSTWHDGCKYGQKRNGPPRKFKLRKKCLEVELEHHLTSMVDQAAAWHRLMSPASFRNMQLFDSVAGDCRLGRVSGMRPYSGATLVMDYAAHPHKDINNMAGGATAIVTLRKPESRIEQARGEEQIHCLPLYGGVGVALPHRSLALEVAKEELHATTALEFPNKRRPERIGLVLYQHKKLNLWHHGILEDICREQNKKRKKI